MEWDDPAGCDHQASDGEASGSEQPSPRDLMPRKHGRGGGRAKAGGRGKGKAIRIKPCFAASCNENIKNNEKWCARHSRLAARVIKTAPASIAMRRNGSLFVM